MTTLFFILILIFSFIAPCQPSCTDNIPGVHTASDLFVFGDTGVICCHETLENGTFRG